MNLAKAVAEHFDPASYNSRRARDTRLGWSSNLEIMRQGTCWHGAGVAVTARQHEAVHHAETILYPDGHWLTERRVWQAEDPDLVFMEWRSEGRLWNGRTVRNGGLTLFDFVDGEVREMRIFTNTAYLEAVEKGWSERLPLDVLLALPAYHTLDLPAIEWKPHPPSRNCKVAGDPLPKFTEPLSPAQRAERAFHAGISYFDVPPEHRLVVAPNGYTEFHGTRWYLAGRCGSESIKDPTSEHPVAIAQRILFTPPGTGSAKAAMSHTMVSGAANDPGIVLFEWISDRITCTGRTFRNHGATVISFDDHGRRVGHREYCNVAYLEAIHVEADVRSRMGEAFSRLEAARTWDMKSDEWQAQPIPEL